MTPDIYDILDVSLREDSYSKLIVTVLERSDVIAIGLFEQLTGKKVRGRVEIAFRKILTESRFDRPDIVLKAYTSVGTWWLVIEAKVQSGEGMQQTWRYWDCCKNAHANRACVGWTLVYLTLSGDLAASDDPTSDTFLWRSMRHLDLLNTIESMDATSLLKNDATLSLLWQAFKNRLIHYSKFTGCSEDSNLIDALATRPSEHFITDHERVSKIANTLFQLPGLKVDGWLYDNRGGKQFLAQAREPHWDTGYWTKEKQLVDCISVHFEVGVRFPIENKKPYCYIHFETNPYFSAKQMLDFAGSKQTKHFEFAREVYRSYLHKSLSSEDWEKTSGALQLARFSCPVNAQTTLKTLGEFLRPRINKARKVINKCFKDVSKRKK